MASAIRAPDRFARERIRFIEGLQAVHAALSGDQRMLVEYKPFEPAFYATDIADWGMSYIYCKHCGPRAKVLVDTGHHYQAQNIEQIVAWLLSEGMLGGFHFNDRRYADDDLTLGCIDPYQVFRIFHEIRSFAWETGTEPDIPYVVDQSHNLKNKIEETLQTAANAQELFLKAVMVDHEKLALHQARGDLVDAEECLRAAFFTDVRPAIREWRKAKGWPKIRWRRSVKAAIFGRLRRNAGRRIGGRFRAMRKALAWVVLLSAAAVAAPVHLRCDYLANPLGIDDPAPRLSWQSDNTERDWHQTAYEIRVASSVSGIDEIDKPDVWDSGKQTSAESVGIVYGGPKLASQTRYHRTVRVWDATGNGSEWAKPAWWEMGLLDSDDWKAKWIRWQNPEDEADRSGIRWIWHPDQNARSVPPHTVCVFRLNPSDKD